MHEKILLLLLDLAETKQMSKDKKEKPRHPQWSLIIPTAERQNQVCNSIWQCIYNTIWPSLRALTESRYKRDPTM